MFSYFKDKKKVKTIFLKDKDKDVCDRDASDF